MQLMTSCRFDRKGCDILLAVQRYYDGANIIILENFDVKPNQKVIITIMDEFIEQTKRKETKLIKITKECQVKKV